MLMSIGKFAKETGLTVHHLRRLQKSGQLIPAKITPGGTRYYSEKQLQEYLTPGETGNKTILYARVSTKNQIDDLNRQINNLKTFAISNGYKFEIITDIGSGINYQKKGLKQLIELINKKQVDRVIILYKDRLIRFGYELIEYLCELNEVKLEVIDNTTMSKEEELTRDLIQIVTVFANRLYGSRSKKTKQILQSIKQ